MEFEYIFEKKVIVKIENEIIGNVLLGKQTNNVFRILHVVVDEKYRGQGIAGKLVFYLVEIARQNNLKLIPVCSFAVSYFQKNLQYNDVLYSGEKWIVIFVQDNVILIGQPKKVFAQQIVWKLQKWWNIFGKSQ